MKDLYKRVELIANVAIIVVALLISTVLIRSFLLSRNINHRHQISVGTRISLPGVDWAKNGQTLLLILSQGCGFCTESAPFYQRLTRELKSRAGIQVVAVLPQSLSNSQQYLNDLNVSVAEIRQAQLDTIGVSGTPTLVLVDKAGLVKEAWVGKLTDDKETEVLSRLQCDTSQKCG